MARIGGGSTKFVLSDRWIVYTKSRKLGHVLGVLYTRSMETIYLSPRVPVGTFFMKSPIHKEIAKLNH